MGRHMIDAFRIPFRMFFLEVFSTQNKYGYVCLFQLIYKGGHSDCCQFGSTELIFFEWVKEFHQKVVTQTNY